MPKKFKTEWVNTNYLNKDEYLSRMLEIYSEDGWDYVDKISSNVGGSLFRVMFIFSKDE
jgi:hypothetical protein